MNGSPAPADSAADTIVLLNLPLWVWQVALAVAGVLALVFLARSIWHPTASSLRWWALGGIIVNSGIAVSGATVRVTESGLGCPEWPRCTQSSFVPVGGDHSALNAAIEFGNRTLTFLVLTVGVIVFIAAWRSRPRRPDLVRLAILQPIGILGQAVAGGITVWSDLHPAAVSAHFLLSTAVVIAAVALYVRCREPQGPLRLAVGRRTRWLATALVPVGGALLIAGTVVTGTGPHGGDAEAPRWGFDLAMVAKVHSAFAWLLLIGAVVLLAVLLRTRAPRFVRTPAVLLVAVVLAQGALGYTQYALALPEGLVVLHVLGSLLTWVAVLRVYFGTARRITTAAADEGPAAGVGAAAAAPASSR